MACDSADAEITALVEALNPTLDEIQKNFRNGNGIIALQYYDMLLALPDLHLLAGMIQEIHSEMKLIEALEKSVNVLDPIFLSRRLKAGRNAPSSDFRASQLRQMVDPEAISDGEINISQRAYTLYEIEHDLEYAWALSLITVLQKAPNEEEHHQEIVDDFEGLFEHSSELLRAIKLKSSCAMDTIIKYHTREGQATSAVLVAALLKYQPEDSLTLTELIEYAKGINVSITPRVAGLLERSFVKCMKKEDAEVVFERYIGVGLIPLSTRMFAFIFNSKTLKKRSVLDYYELMLDYGIPPEPSLLRILCKQCCNMMFPSMHFTQCFRRNSPGSTALNIKAPTPYDQDVSKCALEGTATESTQESLRRDERSYFGWRLRELATEAENRNEVIPLMEGMKIVHRAEVEGTSLENDSIIISELLTFCCNGTTPLKDLVYPFKDSLAYGPGKVTLADDKCNISISMADAEEMSEHSVSRPSLQEVNAFNFELDNNEGELLEGDTVPSTNCSITSSTLKNSKLPAEQAAEKHSESKDRKGGRRLPGIATAEEEAEYVLRVLIEYGARLDNEVLRGLHSRNRYHMRRDPAVMLLAAEAVFDFGQKSRGAMESVSCHYCNFPVSEFARQRNRHRLGRLLRIFVEQYYTYTEVFHTNWDFETKSSTERNTRNFRVLLISAMRIGPLDWSLGLLVLLLFHTPNVVSNSARARLYQVRTTESHRSPHGEVLDLLERCYWERNRILCCDRLMLETHELAETNGNTNEVDPGAKKRSGASQAQESSSYNNSHSTETHPTLFTYLHTVLRELNVSREATNFYKQTLLKQRQILLSSKRPRRS
ncbi:unnamed protein product [Phytomonas sp. EM1]|nr:unnamed protein product [Phytomonas sp. EM1]|eukprot:CCW62954.1 unnamed protein product [Phytomonas sp. isolate EM1]